MRKGTVRCFTFFNIIVLFFVISACGAYGLGSGDSLIVADFFGMPGDTVVDSVIAVNPYPLEGFDFRLVYDSTLLTPLVVSPTARTDYFLTWVPTLSGNGWLYLMAFTDDLYGGGSRPPLPAGEGAVAYIVFLVSSDAEIDSVCDIKFESAPHQNNSFVDTSFKWIFPSLRDGQFTVGPSGVDNTTDCIMPNSFSLSQNYPNPFNATTAISYQQSAISNQLSADGGRSSAVTLRVYNIAGQLVRTLVDERQGVGNHSVLWDGKNGEGEEVGSGVYIYKLRVGDRVFSRKMVLLR